MRNKNISLEDVVYTVKRGDTLGNIASKYANNKDQYLALAAYNDINNPNVIKPGQQIVIPRHLVDNDESNSYNVGTEMEEVNRGYNAATQAPREEPFEYVPASNNTDSDEQTPITILPVINKKSPNYSIRRRSRVAPNRSRAASNNNANRSNNTTTRSNNTTTRNTASNNVTRSNNTVNRTNVVNRSNNVTRPNTTRPNNVNRGTSIVRRNNNVTNRKPVANNNSSSYTNPNWLVNNMNKRRYVSSSKSYNPSKRYTTYNRKNYSSNKSIGLADILDSLNPINVINRVSTKLAPSKETIKQQIAINNAYRRKPHKIGFWR